jgi:uncharacterized protein (TIGR02117 family)
MKFNRLLKSVKFFLLFIVLAFGIYFLLVLIGALVPVNNSFKETPKGIPVFVTTNGFHTDIVLPVRNRRDKCFQIFEHPDFAGRYSQYQYVSYGWGSRNFYLASFDGFPSFSTILSTLFIPNSALMHIEFYKNPLQTSQFIRKILVSEAEYEKLVDLVNASFQEREGYLEKLSISGYDKHDYFFEAKGHYHFFYTCNVWTGNLLKKSGIRVSAWTPFESGVFFYLK